MIFHDIQNNFLSIEDTDAAEYKKMKVIQIRKMGWRIIDKKGPYRDSKIASAGQTSPWHLNRVNQTPRRPVNSQTFSKATDFLTARSDHWKLTSMMEAMAGSASFASSLSPQAPGV
jgi:hypothetical protein